MTNDGEYGIRYQSSGSWSVGKPCLTNSKGNVNVALFSEKKSIERVLDRLKEMGSLKRGQSKNSRAENGNPARGDERFRKETFGGRGKVSFIRKLEPCQTILVGHAIAEKRALAKIEHRRTTGGHHLTYHAASLRGSSDEEDECGNRQRASTTRLRPRAQPADQAA